MRLLIVEDDRALAELLRRSLAAQCVEAELAHTTQDALEAFWAREPHLLVLDLELDGTSSDEPAQASRTKTPAAGVASTPAGLDILEAVRSAASLCPVLVLSAAADTAMRVRCLELGADDCLQKPFSLAELRARCATLLRRRQQLDEVLAAHGAARAESVALLCSGDLILDRLRREARLAGSPLRLTGREFTLLERLLLAGEAVVSREQMRELFGPGAGAEANVVDVHIAALRRKLGESAAAPHIETVRGCGYRLLPGSVCMHSDGPRHKQAFIDTVSASGSGAALAAGAALGAYTAKPANRSWGQR